METPESIRAAYAPVEGETPEQRRRRLASKRAAKYRYFSKADGERGAKSTDRQRRWRETLDEPKLLAIREQNRLRQQARRTKMTADDKRRRNEQQRARRAVMDEQALQSLREREKLRMRRRRDRLQHADGHDPPRSSSDDEQNERDASSVTVFDSGTTLSGSGEQPRPSARLSSSPIMLGLFSPQAAGGSSGALPPAAALGATSRSDDHSVLPPPPAPSLSTARHHHHHGPIEIAPLQFVLPPASSIQSHSFADRTLAPLPQVQNVLPHASTLLNVAGPPQQQQALMPLAIAAGGGSQGSMSNTGPSTASAPPPPPPLSSSNSMNSPFIYPPPPPPSSSLGSLLNPPALSLPPHLSLQSTTQTPGVLPSLSQLPELLATASSGRDFFDSVAATSATGYFPSIADFTGDFETTFRT